MRHDAGQHVRPRPLTEPVFWILLGLAESPQHGYALMKTVAELTDGRMRLTTGTLYGALSRLLEDRSIERVESPDTTRDKQSYRLTAAGRARLHQEAERLRRLARTATARLRLKHA